MAKKRTKLRFDAATWTKALSECIELELLTWQIRMSTDNIRALAIHCHPWHEKSLTISFLTEREPFEEADYGKWSIADWRLYDFTSGPTTHWPCAETLMSIAYEHYMRDEDDNRALETLNELVRCCVKAVKSKIVEKALKKYQLAKDFELFAGHPDSDENYCQSRRRTKRSN